MKKAHPTALFALKSPRLDMTISGCKVVEVPKAGRKLDFHIVGEFFCRLPIPGKTLTNPETLTIYRLFPDKPAKLYAVISLDEVTPDKIPTADIEEESSIEVEEAPEDEKPPEETKEGEKEEKDEEDEDEEEVIEEPMPLAEKLRLLKQAEEAEGDSSISSSSGGYDSKDEEILGRDSSSSSDSDSDVFEPDFQKSFDNAPEKFTVEIGSTAKFQLTLVKNMEHKIFQLKRVTVTSTKDSTPAPKKGKPKKSQ